MSTSMKEAIEYLSKLEADRTAALAVSEEKIREAALIKARVDGFREAMEIFGLNFNPDGVESQERKPGRGQRRNIPQMIFQELSFSGKAMTKEQIASAIGYIPERTEAALNRLERAGQITKNLDGRWETVVIALPRPNGHAPQPDGSSS
jgi:hypothetical protein